MKKLKKVLFVLAILLAANLIIPAIHCNSPEQEGILLANDLPPIDTL